MLNINQYIEEKELEIIRLKNEIERRKILKEKIISMLNTEISIPDYVIEDIIDGEDYMHICLMINVATINNRISKEENKKLNIVLSDKVYTEYEFECLEMDLIAFYKQKELLKKMGIAYNEIKRIWNICNTIREDYCI